jgi:hypothetical protein
MVDPLAVHRTVKGNKTLHPTGPNGSDPGIGFAKLAILHRKVA